MTIEPPPKRTIRILTDDDQVVAIVDPITGHRREATGEESIQNVRLIPKWTKMSKRVFLYRPGSQNAVPKPHYKARR